ncbi:unnamed protein product [Meloidogyne enterolobii]|uniref:Uncharacterized protein n=1 Tax=Meloidogyne enterolobii TaxID=390850 RepID=A0ACB0ZP61_MELEN
MGMITRTLNFFSLKPCTRSKPFSTQNLKPNPYLAFSHLTLSLLQITQQLSKNLYFSLRLKSVGIECQNTWTNLYISLLIYLSYFLLFCNFFYQTYLRSGNRYTKIEKKTKEVLANGNANNITSETTIR